jgi:hypothetical protein
MLPHMHKTRENYQKLCKEFCGDVVMTMTLVVLTNSSPHLPNEQCNFYCSHVVERLHGVYF